MPDFASGQEIVESVRNRHQQGQRKSFAEYEAQRIKWRYVICMLNTGDRRREMNGLPWLS